MEQLRLMLLLDGQWRHNMSGFTFRNPGLTSILTPPPEVIKTGLILHLDASNPASYPGSGATWFDISGNNNHVSLTGSPSFVTNGGGAISFNGSNQ